MEKQCCKSIGIYLLTPHILIVTLSLFFDEAMRTRTNPNLINMIYTVRRFSKTDNREDASKEVLQKAKTSGVVQKVNGKWRIVSIKKGKLWTPIYSSKAKGEEALRGYYANKH